MSPPPAPGVRCRCGRIIPVTWGKLLLSGRGQAGDLHELECYRCGAVWGLSLEKAPGGKPEPVPRRIPIDVELGPAGEFRGLEYRGKPGVEGTDYTVRRAADQTDATVVGQR